MSSIMANIRLEHVSSNVAAEVWGASSHATVFTHPDVLAELAPRHDWWVAKKGIRSICAWPVCLDAAGKVHQPDFSYHVGPVWTDFLDATPAHRRLCLEKSVYESYIRLFLEIYGMVDASLPLGLNDVRVFDWWNYGVEGAERFRIHPRYTARIANLQSASIEVIMAGYRSLRRREIRRVVAAEVPTRTTDIKTAELCSMYETTMSRSSKNVNQTTRDSVAGLVRLVGAGWGEILAFRYPGANEIAYATLVLDAKGVRNIVLNLVAERYRSSGVAAWAIHEVILDAKRKGIDVVDFNGANSPARGDDKHSYGALACLYFDIRSGICKCR